MPEKRDNSFSYSQVTLTYVVQDLKLISHRVQDSVTRQYTNVDSNPLYISNFDTSGNTETVQGFTKRRAPGWEVFTSC